MTEGQIVWDLVGHGQKLGFNSKYTVKTLEDFENGSNLSQLLYISWLILLFVFKNIYKMEEDHSQILTC